MQKVVIPLLLIFSMTLVGQEIDVNELLASKEKECKSQLGELVVQLNTNETEHTLSYSCPIKRTADCDGQSCQAAREEAKLNAPSKLMSAVEANSCVDRKEPAGCMAKDGGRCIWEAINAMKESAGRNISMLKETPAMMKSLLTKAGEGYVLMGVGSWHMFKKMVGADTANTQAMLDLAYEGNEKVYDFMDSWETKAPELAKALYFAVETAAKERYGCKEWDDKIQRTKCLEPMDQWDCADCSQKVGLVCGIVGDIPAEVASIYLTTLTGTVAANYAAKFSQVILQSLRASTMASTMTTRLAALGAKTITLPAKVAAPVAKIKTVVGGATTFVIEGTKKLATKKYIYPVVSAGAIGFKGLRTGWRVVSKPISKMSDDAIARGEKINTFFTAEAAAARKIDRVFNMTDKEQLAAMNKRGDLLKLMETHPELSDLLKANPKLFNLAFNRGGNEKILANILKTSSREEIQEVVKLLEALGKKSKDDLQYFLPKVDEVLKLCK